MTVPDKYRDEYINFDEIEDVLTSVGLVARLAPQVEAKPTCWKWIIVAAHSGLQGAMVCAFSDSSETSILTKKSAKETLDYFHADENQRGKYQRADGAVLRATETPHKTLADMRAIGADKEAVPRY